MSTHVIHAEWIGKHAKVTESTNQQMIGIDGVVVDETKTTLAIETKTGVKKVPKKGTTFHINGEKVKGDDALASPEDRIKIKTVSET